jgi:hypothetical protein
MTVKKAKLKKQNRERQTLKNPRNDGIFVRMSGAEKEAVQLEAKKIAGGNVSKYVRGKIFA